MKLFCNQLYQAKTKPYKTNRSSKHEVQGGAIYISDIFIEFLSYTNTEIHQRQPSPCGGDGSSARCSAIAFPTLPPLVVLKKKKINKRHNI